MNLMTYIIHYVRVTKLRLRSNGTNLQKKILPLVDESKQAFLVEKQTSSTQ